MTRAPEFLSSTSRTVPRGLLAVRRVLEEGATDAVGIRRLFLRGLALIYLFAFLSLWSQIIGLVGTQGILPVAEYLNALREPLGPSRYWLVPTFCWVSSSDAFLHGLCAAGVGCAVLLFIGIAPVVMLAGLWACYLSLTHAGQIFLSFQWDSLLLETGFLAIVFAPWRVRLGRAGPPSVTVLWLLRWLLFRLMFASGVVKLASGDRAWWSLRALNHHYETQPLPILTSWYVHQWPAWIQQASVAGMFIVELGIPFLIFAPRRIRFVACAGLCAFQLLILGTGHYGFFNLLTLLLCVLLLDDRALGRHSGQAGGPEAPPDRWCWPWWVVGPLAGFLLFLSVTPMAGLGRGRIGIPDPALSVYRSCAPFHLVNSYGLFSVMTTSRPEIIVEGSQDGRTWQPYGFHYKPGDPARRPPVFLGPHMPRLDWQMWFAALGSYRTDPWFIQFARRVLEGSPPVLAALKSNPFPERPPRYLRARLYEYRFTDRQTRRELGHWWRRDLKGLYAPIMSLR